jgi:N utilization substance protein A
MRAPPQSPLATLEPVLDRAATEMGVPRAVLVQALERAIEAAARKHFGAERRLEARYDRGRGAVELFQILAVVDAVAEPAREISVDEARRKGSVAAAGDELVFQIFYRDEDAERARAQIAKYGEVLALPAFHHGFGRIAAQVVRQVVRQRVRSAERDRLLHGLEARRGQIVDGVVRRFEHGDLVVAVDGVEAVLPDEERIPREMFRPGDRVRAYLLAVEAGPPPRVVLSRASPRLLERLFAEEVPEIADGAVAIEATAREPGERAKIAVLAHDDAIDPVGACVGIRGRRVQAVSRELAGERIDVLRWDEDLVRMVCAALAPARVVRVVIYEDERALEVFVPDAELTLAVGRRGQNARLASQLVGWRLDVRVQGEATPRVSDEKSIEPAP